MALGTMTIVEVTKEAGSLKVIVASFAGDDAYPTGGTATAETALNTAIKTAAAAATDANVRGNENVEIVGIMDSDCGQYVPIWDAANNKLKMRDGGHATWDEVADTTDLSGTTCVVKFLVK